MIRVRVWTGLNRANLIVQTSPIPLRHDASFPGLRTINHV